MTTPQIEVQGVPDTDRSNKPARGAQAHLEEQEASVTYPSIQRMKSLSTSSVGSGVNRTFMIGIAGGTGSGKKAVAEYIQKQLHEKERQDHTRVMIVSLDQFYKEVPADKGVDHVNFDHPESFDFDLLHKVMHKIRNRKSFRIPQYNESIGKREGWTKVEDCPDIVIFEGLFVLYKHELLRFLDVKVFVAMDDDVRLSRRVMRDMKIKKMPLESILNRYLKHVKPCFDHYVSPTKEVADIVIPRGVENQVAMDLLTAHMGKILKGEIILSDLDEQDFSDSSYSNVEMNLIRPH
eukprot:Clim_evm48s146 gene=Clim_evmTU48s146